MKFNFANAQIKVFLSAALGLAPVASRADVSSSARGAPPAVTTSTTTSTVPTTTSTQTTTTATTDAPATTTTPATNYGNGYGGGGGSMNSGAKSSRAQALVGVGMNGAAAAMYFSACSSSAWWNCVLAGMHVAQAGMMLQGARGAGRTADATNFRYDPSLYGGGPVASGGNDINGDGIPDGAPGANGGAGNGSLDADLARAERDVSLLSGRLGEQGVRVSPDGKSVTVGDKTYPTSAFGSDAGLASLGLSPSQISELNDLKAKAAARAKDKARVIAMSTEEGGGGGGSGGRGGKGVGGYNEPNFGNLFGDKNGRKPASVKGLSKQLGNDRIGVKNDNIFEMISRQYQKEEGKQSFIQTPAAPVAAPGKMVPASAPARPAGY